MKKYLQTLCLASFLFVFTACSFQIPQKVTVKTKAEYNFSIGDIDYSFDDYFDKSAIFEGLNKDTIKVMDYYPEKRESHLQQYLLKMPIQEIPIDVSGYFNDSNFGEALDDISFSQDIKIPQVGISFEKEIDKTSVNGTINALLTITGNTNSGTLAFSSEFNRVLYKSGKLKIECSEISDGESVTIKTQSGTRTATFGGGKAELDMADFAIYKNGTELIFTDDSGKAYTGSISDDSEVLKAFGITIPTPIEVPISTDFQIADSSNAFQSCVINEGSLNVGMHFPSTWTHATCSYGMDLTGALNASCPNNTVLEKRIDLKDKEISVGKVNVEASVTVGFTNSDIDMEDPLKISISSNLISFSSITVDVTDLTTSIDKSEDFPDALKNTVKEIKLEPSGITGTYTNGLPAGNDITIAVNSDFFEITNKSDTLTSNTTNHSFSILADDASTKSTFNKWDIKVDIGLPGATAANPNRLVLKNVRANTTYKLAVNIKPSINWESITIDTASTNQRDTVSLGFNINKLFEEAENTLGIDLFSKVNLANLPIYLMAEKPTVSSSSSPSTDLLENARFEGTLKIFYGKNKTKIGSYERSLLSGGVMEFVPAPTIKKENNIVVTDVSKFAHSVEIDLAELIKETKNETEGEFYIDYDLTFSNGSGSGELVITQDMIASGSNASSISVYALIVLPLKFTVDDSDDFIIDIIELAGGSSDSDLFGRDGPESFEDLEDAFGLIKSCSLVYSTSKMPFYSNQNIQFLLDLTGSGTPTAYNIGSGSVNVSKESLSDLLEVYPLKPGVQLKIPKGASFSLDRESSIDMNLKLKLKTDGEYTVYGGDK